MTMIEEIENFVRPILSENRFELVETHYRKEAGRWVLRLFIDKMRDPSWPAEVTEDGVTLGDCEKVSALVGDRLDSSQLIGDSYVLEVSSPGINRPLKNEAHFLDHIGEKVKVSLYSPLTPESRQRNFSGILMGCENQAIEVDDPVSGRVTIPLSAVAKANLDLI